jgi:hypothetical protein
MTINLAKDTYVIISGESGYFASLLSGQDLIINLAKVAGSEVVEITGKYNLDDEIEHAVIVKFDDTVKAENWGIVMSGLFGQESFILSRNGWNELIFARDRSQDVTGQGITWHTEEPECFYSTLPDGQFFTLTLDFDS